MEVASATQSPTVNSVFKSRKCILIAIRQGGRAETDTFVDVFEFLYQLKSI